VGFTVCPSPPPPFPPTPSALNLSSLSAKYYADNLLATPLHLLGHAQICQAHTSQPDIDPTARDILVLQCTNFDVLQR
jgi:hypothetical protein